MMSRRRKISFAFLVVILVALALFLGKQYFRSTQSDSSHKARKTSASDELRDSSSSSIKGKSVPLSSKAFQRATDARLSLTRKQPTRISHSDRYQKIKELKQKLLMRISNAESGEVLLRNHRTEKQEDSSIDGKLHPLLSQGLPHVSTRPSKSPYPRYDRKGRVLIRIRYTPGVISKELIEQKVVDHGGEVYAHLPNAGILEAYLPNEALQDWTAFDWLKGIDPVGPAFSRVGSVTTEADSLLGVELARGQYDVDGSDVKIGVISTGIDNIAQSQASGDLPQDVTVIANGGWYEPDDEGTAMLEIIHDLAPGAKLFFHDGGSETRFMMAVDAFQNNGCHIIVDDIGYLFEPFFEDGQVAQKVADAIADGIIFVSAAGNDADRHTEVNWKATHDDPGEPNLNELLFGVPALVFPNDEEEIIFELGPFHGGQVVLQWTERFGQAGHDYDIWVYEFDDYILFLYDLLVWFDWEDYGYNDWFVTGYWYDSFEYIHFGEPPYPVEPYGLTSREIQNGDDDPLEFLYGTNDSFEWVAYILIVEGWSSPSTSDRLKMVFGDWGYTEAVNLPGDMATPSRSIFGHPAVPATVAVGAINASDASLDDIEPFSSQGPSYVPFSSMALRPKPDICALDGVSVTGAGGFPPSFLGTSAAAPHVAALAALIKEHNPTLPGPEIRSILQNTADDLGSPGQDSIFGYGRINIQPALQAATTFSIADAIRVLKIMVGVDPGEHHIYDLNNDGKIGLQEVIYILGKVTGLRN